jgi:G3E family GTPase
MPASERPPLPVTVIGGYLGAGKTTLVNHLLRHAGGKRLAVLVNDFGELPIDADLIESQNDAVISLAGGCLCCSFGSDLLGAVNSLTRRVPRPDQLLIEASGVALPDAIAASLSLLREVALDAVVVVADADSVRARAADRYLADTIERQLRAADLVVLNKIDLVPADGRGALYAWLDSMAPDAKRLDALRGQLPPEAVLGVEWRARSNRAHPLRGLHSSAGPRPHARQVQFEHLDVTLDARVDAGALARALAQPALGVIRAKGILRDRDGATIALHLVGTRSEISPRAGNVECGRLVCIGLAGRLDRAGIAAALARQQARGRTRRTYVQ